MKSNSIHVGTRVHGISSDVFPIKFRGVVIGHGWKDDELCYLVKLDEGGYIKNETTVAYVSVIVVMPQYLEEDLKE